MDGPTIIFYLLAALTLGSGLLAVTARKIFRAAIFLLFSLIGIAGFYFWLQYEFIAAVQIVVYVGGIVVLIIFSIFLTQQGGTELPNPPLRRIVFAALAALFGLVFSWTLVSQHPFEGNSAQPMDPSVANIGSMMLNVNDSGYALPFELVSILLLAAMIGCIVIAIKSRPEIMPEPKAVVEIKTVAKQETAKPETIS
jgi:NADH-quinone oxidoreductase subunit J